MTKSFYLASRNWNGQTFLPGPALIKRSQRRFILDFAEPKFLTWNSLLRRKVQRRYPPRPKTPIRLAQKAQNVFEPLASSARKKGQQCFAKQGSNPTYMYLPLLELARETANSSRGNLIRCLGLRCCLGLAASARFLA